MSSRSWKISTFAALGAAAFFAVHPVRDRQTGATSNAKDAGKTALSSAERPTSSSGSLFGWFGGGTATAATSAPPGSPAKALELLRAAKTPNATCEALQALGPVADDESVSAIADHAQKGRFETRACAITALGVAPPGSARSWLEELVSDKDTQIRIAAVQALAARPDDPEARSIVLGVAKTADKEVRMAAILALGNAHAKEATPLLLEAMNDADLNVQREIIMALGGTGDAGAVAALATIARDGATSVRGEALSALGQIGGDQAISVLAAALGEGHGNDVRSAANALAQIDDAGARSALLAAADADRRDVASAALYALEGVDGDDVHALMLKNLSSAKPEGHASAARYFRSHPDEAVVATLTSMAQHGGRDASSEAMATLATIGGDAARAALVDIASQSGTSQTNALQQLSAMPGGKEDAHKLAIALLRDGGPAARTAVSLLADDGSSDGRQALLDAARAGDGTSAEAMSALARRGDPASVKALGDLAQAGKDAQTKAQALSALGQCGDPAMATTLTTALKDTDPAVRRAAIDGLAMLGGPAAEKAVLDATSSADPALRTTAVQALARNPSTPAAAAQLERLANDPDRSVANAAFWGLASSSPEKAAKVAAAQMQSPDVDARRQAISVSRMLEPDRARELLLGGLDDTDPAVAMSAARSLTSIGDTASQNALAAMLTRADANPDVRRAAADSLGEIGGETARRFADLIAQYGSAGARGGGRGTIVIDSME